MPVTSNNKKEKVQNYLDVSSGLISNTKMKTNSKKLYNLYVHDERFSKQDVVINQEHFPNINSGDLLEIFHPESTGPSNNNWNNRNNSNSKYINNNQKHKHAVADLIHSLPIECRRLIIQVSNIDKDISIRQPQLQISVANHIASLFELQARTDVVVRKIDFSEVTADYIEVTFRDQYISRGDMWRFKLALEGTCVYVGKNISYAGLLRAQVKKILVNGRKVACGYITNSTKTIFRSESSKFYIFIQMSREMWDFDEDGELFYEKALTGFFPTLFKKWTESNTNHTISIILFSRIFYNHIDEAPENDNAILYDSQNRPYKDFYRVVIDFETRMDSFSMLTILKREFVQFQKDILQRSENGSTILSGNNSPACEGNVLEAINLALNPFDKHYMDRNILRTGLSIVVVTPGTGIFEVDKKLLRLTTQRMIDNGVSLDLVCLSRPPLYLVPLMQYYSKELSLNTNQESVDNSLSSFNERKLHKNESFEKPGESSEKKVDVWDPLYFDDPNNDNPEHIFYNIPYWIDCSFWNNNQDTEDKNNNSNSNNNQFLLRCKMYDVQMMGITEQAGSSILIPYLDANPSEKINSSIEPDQNTIDYDRYDEGLFHYDQKSHSRTRFNARIANSSHNITPDNTYSVTNPIKVSDSNRSIDNRDENPIVSQRNKILKDSASATSSVSRRNDMRHSNDSRLYIENNLRLEPIRSTTSIKINNSNSSNYANSEINIASSFGTNGNSMIHNTHIKNKLELQKNEISMVNTTTNGVSNLNLTNTKSYRKSFGGERERPKSFTSNINIDFDHIRVLSEVDNTNGDANSVTTDTSKNTQVAPICIKHSTRYNNYTGSYRDTDNRNSISESLKFCSPQNDTSKHIVKLSPGKPGTIRHIKQNYINPCNPTKNKMRLSSHICRWHHVFPKSMEPTSNKATMKWKSLCTPACLPLTTDFFPKQDDLRDYYEEYTYALAPDDEYILYPENSDDSLNFIKRIDSLLKEMISQRLSKGFQLIISNITNNMHIKQSNVPDYTNNSVDNRKYPNSFKDEGAWPQSISKQQYYLSLGDHLHKLYYDSTRQNIEIKRYVRKINYSTNPITYKCSIWPKSQDFYQTRTITFKYPSLATYNWNYLDHFISGSQKDTADSLEFLSARFILIPLDTVPQNSTLLNPTNEQLDEEELRIAGFSKFIDVFEKLKLSQHNDRNDRDQSLNLKRINKSNILRKIQFTTYSTTSFTPNPLDLKRQIQLSESRHSHRRGSVQLMERLSKNSSIESIAHAMQHADGVPCRDRRWHFRVYERTFIGSDFVEWMIRSFHDIDTREEAVEFGNHLLNKGMFEHVTKKHHFLDGFYFYRLRAEFSLPKDHPDRGAMRWFRTQKANLQDSNDTIDDLDRLPFKLSQSLIIDVDPLQKSNRCEVATLHYDTVYNPMNCYHFQLHWLVCTARLIEDQLTSWSRFAERCGFKLVEAPYQQIQQYSNANPFQSVSVIKLSLLPPNIDLVFQELENSLPYSGKGKINLVRTDSIITNGENENRKNSNNDSVILERSNSIKDNSLSLSTYDNNEKEKTPIKENLSSSDLFEIRKNSNNSEMSVESKKSNNTNNTSTNPNANNNSTNVKPLQLRDIEIPMYWYESELLKFFGFVLDLESDHQFKRPVKYSYEKPENKNIQFVHRSGMAFVQICEEDHSRFLWVNNSLYNSGKSNINPNPRLNSSSLTNVDLLHEHFQKFCQDPKKLQELWEKSTQKLLLITKGMNKQLEEISDEILSQPLDINSGKVTSEVSSIIKNLLKNKSVNTYQDDKRNEEPNLSNSRSNSFNSTKTKYDNEKTKILENKGGSENDINSVSETFNMNKNFNNLINENAVVDSFNSNDDDNINFKAKHVNIIHHQNSTGNIKSNKNDNANKNENADNVHYNSDNNLPVNNESDKPLFINHLSSSPK